MTRGDAPCGQPVAARHGGAVSSARRPIRGRIATKRDHAGPACRLSQLCPGDLGIGKLRLLFRLAFDLTDLDKRRYEHAAHSLDEVGRLIGSWRKASLFLFFVIPAHAGIQVF
ncbi:MAG: hypothetical protein GVY13_13345 [Alphaproteobacteria bacterium]|nr:hypothetical protein [Alphaproteobacteria bacterium]